jgi:hypothetical protein
MDTTVTEEDTVVRGVGIEPTRKMKGGFNEEKLPVGIPKPDG